MSRPVVGIASVGVCCPLGRSLDELWAHIARGEDGFADVDRFPLPDFPSRQASAFSAEQVARLCAEAGHADPAVAYAILAGRDALAGVVERDGIALVLATSAGAADTHDAYDRARREVDALDAELLVGGAFTSFATLLSRVLGLHGPTTTVSTACASGTHALGLAIDLVRSGDAARVLVVGSDAVHPSLFGGFHSVGALAAAPCAPFGRTFGMSLGEGAAALLLQANAADPLGVLLGWGGSADAYHPTAPDPLGSGMARSLVDAVADAGLEAARIGAYNAHGTGTEANDPAETAAVRSVLGDAVPVSATKSQIGHAQGAAGVLEAVVTLAGLRAQAVPPTLRCRPPRRIAPVDPVAEGRARPWAYEVAMSHSAAFGGTNATVLIGRRPEVAPPADPSPVYALGTGVAGPFEGSAGQVLDPEAPSVAAPEPAVRLRRMDPVSTLLTRAVAVATAAAGLDPTRPSDRVGMVVGMADGPQQSIRAFVDSRDQRGLARCSASAFARMVFNAPAGVASTALQLRGANLTLWSGHGAGAQAIAYGARMLREHPRLEAVVVAAADEVGHVSRDRARVCDLPGPPVAAAGAVVLSHTPGPARLLGSATGPADDWRRVLQAACGSHEPDRMLVSADPGRIDLEHLAVDARLGHAPAASGVIASAAAIDWIRAGWAASVIVLVVSEDAGATALLWAAPGGEVRG